MNSIILGTIEEPGPDTHKVSTLETPSGGAVNTHTIKGQVAVITGAAGGIGQALALDMTRRGAAGIALVDFSDRVVQVAREINAEAGRQVAIAYRGDTTISAETSRNLIDHNVDDESGEHIGTIHSFWSDENTGKLEFLGIKTGWLFGKTHVVPVQGVQFEEGQNAIRVPYPASFIKEAPNFEPEDNLSEAEEDEIFNYYGVKGASTQPAVIESARSDRAAVRPAPDAETSSAEIALHEEQLKVGKRNVVAGQVRLHKIVRTEEVHVPVELKSEHVVIERIPASEAKGTGATSFNEERIEIPLSREEAVIEKVSQVTGGVRLRKTEEVRQETVHDSVRREDVEEERVDSSEKIPKT